MNPKGSTPPSSFSDVATFPGPPLDAQRAIASEYRPWRKFRYVAEDHGVNPAHAWAFAKACRLLHWREIPVPRADGGRFGLCAHPRLNRMLHLIDRASGDDVLSVAVGEPVNAAMRKRLQNLFRGQELIPHRMQARTRMSEAAESSIMEGASATRQQALDLLRSGRAPATLGERMILNNYEAMRLLKRRLAEPLSIELILELHTTLTEDTLDDAEACGRFRLASEDVRVVDTRDGSTLFTPPSADKIRPLLKDACDFANGDHTGPRFLHPIVVASILHFLTGYIHPFVDGNGRTARALFYWFALKHGYGIFEYLTISEIIRKGYAQYPQAYLDTETDDGDLTYFVLYHLDVIEKALDRFAEHLETEERRIENSRRFLLRFKDLNLRQRLLLEHALRHPETQYTVKSHMNSNGISINTARADLDDLVRRKLMVTTKRVREVVYLAVPNLTARLEKKRR